MANYQVKDPNAVLDYSLDWSEWLGDDTIHASSWTVPAGLTMTSSSFAATVATVWLSGGTAGRDYTIENRITTHGGRTEDHSTVIQVRER